MSENFKENTDFAGNFVDGNVIGVSSSDQERSDKANSDKTSKKPLRELGRLCLGATGQANHPVIVTEVCTEPRGGLPLLQVWPSDSPRGEADGQAFVFPDVQDNVNDSGIESIQKRSLHYDNSENGKV
ncbi:hypothetical protein TSAR_015917 [Trichomalopsis sarcophagae]|uniref:Uncharacterized protein n=1 Tax=Trichomalopsis sarcophagae TaxID=543379 RepID=A0A232EXX3_9HYME|nr:hypothetical protein TSAR_015917 [Trichomalopsis sarcophagae]